jgi:hypothetical protein
MSYFNFKSLKLIFIYFTISLVTSGIKSLICVIIGFYILDELTSLTKFNNSDVFLVKSNAVKLYTVKSGILSHFFHSSLY